jgi:two-component system KDP operon response regulator KdpE
MTRVLLVEDEDLNRVLVRAILARASEPAVRDLELLEAGTLETARTTLGTEEIDLLLLDVNLPDGNGLDLARELSARDERPHVIALTASVLPHERAAAMAAGCDGFLDKPYGAADLVGVISSYLPPDGRPP